MIALLLAAAAAQPASPDPLAPLPQPQVSAPQPQVAVPQPQATPPQQQQPSYPVLQPQVQPPVAAAVPVPRSWREVFDSIRAGNWASAQAGI
ncbi:MAG TPA: hypothetical protein VNS53_04945, partial [Sphingomicrobium sp.]|nr:hypothetical protein [Sphingomicrobium sp.]